MPDPTPGWRSSLEGGQETFNLHQQVLAWEWISPVQAGAVLREGRALRKPAVGAEHRQDPGLAPVLLRRMGMLKALPCLRNVLQAVINSHRSLVWERTGAGTPRETVLTPCSVRRRRRMRRLGRRDRTQRSALAHTRHNPAPRGASLETPCEPIRPGPQC